MLRLSDKFNFRLFSKKTTRRASRQVGGILPVKPGTQGEAWSHAEVHLLLSAEKSRTTVKVQLPGTDKPFDTLVLGMDLTGAQLLLDRFQPALPVHRLADEQPFWLSLACPGGEYRLCVQPREFLPGQQLVAEILATEYREPRLTGNDCDVGFAGAGPRIDLQLRSGKSIRGRVTALGTEGAIVALDAAAAPAFRQAQERLRCSLMFNQRFQLRCSARATRPATAQGERHLLSLAFTHMDAADRAQLQAYLRACQMNSEQAA